MKRDYEAEGFEAGQQFANDNKGGEEMRRLRHWCSPQWVDKPSRWQPKTVRDLAELTCRYSEDEAEDETRKLEALLKERYGAVDRRQWIDGFMDGAYGELLAGEL